MRRFAPPRIVRGQLRRNRKQERMAPKVSHTHKRDWLAVLGNVATVITSIFVAVAVAGPENVKNIPKIPTVANTAFNEFLAQREFDKNLTGTWTSKIPGRPSVPAFKMILDMKTRNGLTDSMMTTPASIPWSMSEFTDIEVIAKGEFLELEFWGFVSGDRKIFAKSRIRIFPEPCPGVCENINIDFTNLTMETYWQSSPILPKTLQLTKI